LAIKVLKNKRILITAGPTWVPIDGVRVISNIATGQTGILLAKQLSKSGAKVTLALGPVSSCCVNNKVKIINFRFFDELRSRLKKELRSKKYDIIIHSAAVSDFKPAQPAKGKLVSERSYNLKLSPLPKIIKDIRILNPKAKLVMFKLETGVSDNVLIQRAELARDKVKADFVVANRINPYRAFIIDRKSNIVSAKNKRELVKKLLTLIT
jgi:phosphopantothenoylcysteine decarboxylase/phosphopantothenate--cysteine ligase